MTQTKVPPKKWFLGWTESEKLTVDAWDSVEEATAKVTELVFAGHSVKFILEGHELQPDVILIPKKDPPPDASDVDKLNKMVGVSNLSGVR